MPEETEEKNGQPDVGPKSSKSNKARSRKRRKGRKGKRSVVNQTRVAAPFPKTPIESALAIGNAIQQFGGGQKKIRRLTLFEKLDKAPDSGPSRTMVTNSGRYGITTGSYKADFLELTELGQAATAPESTPSARKKALFELGIAKIAPFQRLYETNVGKRLPSPEVMRDQLAEAGVDEGLRKECVEIFLENAKFLGILRTSAGAERLVPVEQILEEMPTTPAAGGGESAEPGAPNQQKGMRASLGKTCFFIAPIGDEVSEERKHSDMMLEALIERALEGSDLKVVRADHIGDPGMISGQVIKYLLNAALVIADLSFHNPNVFYELAIRHMVGRPTVHVIRKDDPIPFDVKDFRTIVVDTGDKYELVAKLETYRAEIANHVRIALASGTEGSNPIRAFTKDLKVEVGSKK